MIKKVIFIVSMLFVAVASTACINNLAVQDLNNKAQAFMEQGDYKQAIERLKSSLDLDSSIFETNYNLAIAYSKEEDYTKALDQFKKVLQLKPNFSQCYYSLATTQYNLAHAIEKARYRVDENDNLQEQEIPSEAPEDDGLEVQLPPKEFNYMYDLYSNALKNYKKYLELEPNAKEKDEVNKQIEKISEFLQYSKKQEI